VVHKLGFINAEVSLTPVHRALALTALFLLLAMPAAAAERPPIEITVPDGLLLRPSQAPLAVPITVKIGCSVDDMKPAGAADEVAFFANGTSIRLGIELSHQRASFDAGPVECRDPAYRQEYRLVANVTGNPYLHPGVEEPVTFRLMITKWLLDSSRASYNAWANFTLMPAPDPILSFKQVGNITLPAGHSVAPFFGVTNEGNVGLLVNISIRSVQDETGLEWQLASPSPIDLPSNVELSWYAKYPEVGSTTAAAVFRLESSTGVKPGAYSHELIAKATDKHDLGVAYEARYRFDLMITKAYEVALSPGSVFLALAIGIVHRRHAKDQGRR
jgi:hypothetical protein